MLMHLCHFDVGEMSVTVYHCDGVVKYLDVLYTASFIMLLQYLQHHDICNTGMSAML